MGRTEHPRGSARVRMRCEPACADRRSRDPGVIAQVIVPYGYVVTRPGAAVCPPDVPVPAHGNLCVAGRDTQISKENYI